jgi:4-amino-4-deoxy-L-arabinose transferase-like glycosyltransferase
VRPVLTSPWLRLIVLAAAALRLFPIWFGLPYPHARPDEAVAIGHAMDVLEGRLNPQFFHWPSLTFYVFAAVFAAASLIRRLFLIDPQLDAATAVILARGVVALAGTATVAVLYRIGRRAADDTTGLIAAALLTVAILHVRDSHFAMTDVLMTFLLTVSLAALLRALDSALEAGGFGEMRWVDFARAGLAGGLAASTKYNAGAVIFAMLAGQVVLWYRHGAAPWQLRTWRPTLAFGLACAAGFLVGTPFAVLDYPKFSEDLIFDFTHLSGGHGINLGRGWQYHVTTSLPYGAGLLTFAAALPGAGLLLARNRRHALVLGVFAIAFYAAIGSGYTVFFRYVLPLVPLVCLLAALTVRHAAAWLAPRIAWSPAAATVLVAGMVAGPSAVNSVWFDVLLARQDTRVIAGEWLAAHVGPEDSVHDAGGDYARLDLGRTPYHFWLFDPATDSFGHPEGHTPDWLVLTTSPLRTYANADAYLRRLATERYDLAFTVRGTRGAAGSAVYDLQDAFFMPVSGFHTVERPGPTISIYKRRE